MNQRIKTVVLKIDPNRLEQKKIQIVAEIIRNNGLVAFPTETVYGLGANALVDEAVLRIFKAKNRPADNPLIVHIASEDDVNLLVESIPPQTEKLIKKFWPGPLTLLMPKSDFVPNVTTAGLSTVAIRMPNHPIAQALIKESDTPIAAPSANLAGKPSPTSAKHVLADLNGKVEAVIDGGEITYGVESTVLDLTAVPPVVLRPGPVTVEELRELIGEVEIHPIAKAETAEATVARAPGMKYKHYAPKAEIAVVEGGELKKIKQKVQEIADARRKLGKVGILATDETFLGYRADIVKSMGSRKNVRAIAKNLFKLLRELDSEGVRFAVAEGIEPYGIGLAVMNRLRKAAGHNIVRLD